MKKACKVILIVVSALAAVVGICTLVCGYMMISLRNFEFDDDMLFEEEKDVYPEVAES